MIDCVFVSNVFATTRCSDLAVFDFSRVSVALPDSSLGCGYLCRKYYYSRPVRVFGWWSCHYHKMKNLHQVLSTKFSTIKGL